MNRGRHTCTHIHMHACAHTRTHAHTHTQHTRTQRPFPHGDQVVIETVQFRGEHFQQQGGELVLPFLTVGSDGSLQWGAVQQHKLDVQHRLVRLYVVGHLRVPDDTITKLSEPFSRCVNSRTKCANFQACQTFGFYLLLFFMQVFVTESRHAMDNSNQQCYPPKSVLHPFWLMLPRICHSL